MLLLLVFVAGNVTQERLTQVKPAGDKKVLLARDW